MRYSDEGRSITVTVLLALLLFILVLGVAPVVDDALGTDFGSDCHSGEVCK